MTTEKFNGEKPVSQGSFSGNRSHSNQGDGFRFEGQLPSGITVDNNQAWNNGGHGFVVSLQVAPMLNEYGFPDQVDRRSLAAVLNELLTVHPVERHTKLSSVLSGVAGASERFSGLTANLLAISSDPRVVALIAALSF